MQNLISPEIAEMESDLNAFIAQCEANRVELTELAKLCGLIDFHLDEDSKPVVSTEIAEMEADLSAFIAQCEANRVELKGSRKAIITKRRNKARIVLQLVNQIAYNPSAREGQLNWVTDEARKALTFYFK